MSKKPIGEVGEDYIEEVLTTPLGRDFLFRGQKYRDGRNEIELCDLLLLLDDTAVLMEIKTADRNKRPDRTNDEWSKWANKRLDDAISQLRRGIQAIRTGLVTEVQNPRQGVVQIDPSKIRNYYAIAIVDHPELDKYGKGPVITIDDLNVSVMTTSHSEVFHLTQELSTAPDLISYMNARAVFFEKHAMLGITELDLLAAYKSDPEEFLLNVQRYDQILIAEGYWDEFAKLDIRKRRDEANIPSLVIDAIIDRLHESNGAELPHIAAKYAKHGIEPPTATYIEVANELARIPRIDRRVLGQRILSMSDRCIETGKDQRLVSRTSSGEGAACAVVISTASRENRIASLELAALAAILKFQANRVVGVATEPCAQGYGFSVDAILIEIDPDELRSSLSAEEIHLLESQFGAMRMPDASEFEPSTES